MHSTTSDMHRGSEGPLHAPSNTLVDFGLRRAIDDRVLLKLCRVAADNDLADKANGSPLPPGHMSTPNSFSWGAETLERGEGGRRDATAVGARSPSLMGSRIAATIIDGFVLLVPVFSVAWLLSIAFPHRGFFLSKTSVSATGSHTSSYGLQLPGVLIVSALSLSYFFVLEALRGQTIGKRAMGLTVRSASGGRAGLNAVSARTVLRLIDGLPAFYLLGALVALISGSRRRRLGDWAGGTVVVRDTDVAYQPTKPMTLSAALYPATWLLATLLAIFGLGIGTAVAEREQAIVLVQSYVKARERGDASLACSMLTAEQQRELVAIQSNDYPHASASECPRYILGSEANSHLLNPALGEMVSEPMLIETVLGAVVLRSPVTGLELIAVPDKGSLKLDMRGVERLGFIKDCSAAGRASESLCACTFTLLRVQALVPERGVTPSILRAIDQDALRCRTNLGAQTT